MPDTSRDGIAVFDRHPLYLGLITWASEIARTYSFSIQRVQSVEFLPLFDEGSFSPKQIDICNSELERLRALLEGGYFHASLGAFDLTRSLQSNQAMPRADFSGPAPFFWNKPCIDDILLKLRGATPSRDFMNTVFWHLTIGHVSVQVLEDEWLCTTVHRLAQSVACVSDAEGSVHATPLEEVEHILSSGTSHTAFVYQRLVVAASHTRRATCCHLFSLQAHTFC